MTAIVGVLNRRGLAFAADSAATSFGFKISNNANKIFSLSKFHPIGIAIYNCIDLMGVPWDSIIKQFRNSLKDKKFDTLQDYTTPFFEFVKSYCLGSLTVEQSDNMSQLASAFYQEIEKKVVSTVGEPLCDANAETYFDEYIKCLNEEKNIIGNNRSADFENYKFSDFEKYTNDSVNRVLTTISSHQKCPSELRKLFTEALFAFVCQDKSICINNQYTGLVFFGYGDKDVFPSLLEYHVTYAIDKRIKYSLISSYAINNQNPAIIAPFAQTDVANTVVRAVEENLKNEFYNSYSKSIRGFRDEIVNQMLRANAPQGLVDILNGLNIDKYIGGYKDGMNQYITSNYTEPLVKTIAQLEKEDLSDMAESLVKMTCLKRHVTSTVETVGGPVDVAIVTKGDGFIWKNRKHYFDPELNSQFFERYKK